MRARGKSLTVPKRWLSPRSLNLRSSPALLYNIAVNTAPPISRSVKLWLMICLGLVFCMVVIGGLTRLTESGLSIVEWKLVSGILPPMHDAAWEEEFAAYRTSPQYRQVNVGMSLREFRHIFWLEYIHRLLGRLVGLAFALPLAVFWLRKRLPPPLAGKMLRITALVGAQGAVGWLMVSSGLRDVPWVSPYRLALHLGLAVVIFCALIRVLYPARPGHGASAPLRRLSRLTAALVFVQMLIGALVAGMDAGLAYNTWPLMDGSLIPPHVTYTPTWVQFLHRWTAVPVVALILYQHVSVTRKISDPRTLRVSWGTLALVAAQFALGVATLVLAVPTALAALHQATALLLIGFCVLLSQMLYSAGESERR